MFVIALIELRRSKQKAVDLTTGAIGVSIVIGALIPFCHLSVTPLPQLATFLFNVLLFLLAVGLIREGLALGR